MIDTSGQDKDGANTATTCLETNHCFSPGDALALEVGHSAYEYLEECFYTEVSVLDRERFNAIPEIVKSDFTITVSEHCHYKLTKISQAFSTHWSHFNDCTPPSHCSGASRKG